MSAANEMKGLLNAPLFITSMFLTNKCIILQDAAAEMVVMCCRFLCYFCRTSGQNQRAMFEHLSYLLDNSSMLLGKTLNAGNKIILVG